MQHAVGGALPPSHGPHRGAAAGPPAPPGGPDPGHPVHPGAPGRPPAPPAHQPPPGHDGAPPVPGTPPGTGWAPPSPRHGSFPPAEAGGPTGHIPLPSGAPVPLPESHAVNDTTQITLAVLLIGPAGAGKTTVARHWAGSRRLPTAHISLDDVREWVRSGFADPQSGWNDHSEAQYRLARRTCGFAARNFLANGISCILDDAVFPDRPVVGLGGWKRHVGPGLLPVVLLPGLEVVLERNAARSGNRRLSDEEVARIHGRMAGWYGSGLPIIDNSQYDVETTARALDDALARSIASPPSW
ncbi:AAA family ATPase [Streptomyces meridianus]|uniref:ATP-binding protein n=1 Tax=Streptomyces meridianus TaxID=2938945 RepID=A0ABT0XCM3_9ACTN|nr:AAA family ATPase [Streptomyces meridianus]MCM2579467.1 ATP-binding protein [Streptomyces meridianus]